MYEHIKEKIRNHIEYLREWDKFMSDNSKDIEIIIYEWLKINKIGGKSINIVGFTSDNDLEIEINYCNCCSPEPYYIPIEELFNLDIVRQRMQKREEQRKLVEQATLEKAKEYERQQYLKLKEKFENEHNGPHQ